MRANAGGLVEWSAEHFGAQRLAIKFADHGLGQIGTDHHFVGTFVLAHAGIEPVAQFLAANYEKKGKAARQELLFPELEEAIAKGREEIKTGVIWSDQSTSAYGDELVRRALAHPPSDPTRQSPPTIAATPPRAPAGGTAKRRDP